jgi:PAS domain-containing protein
MINASHPGTTPDAAETASDLHSATGQPGTIGDWAASLAKLLKVAIRAVDTTILRGRFVTAETELQRHSHADITDHASAKATTTPGAEGKTRSDRLEIRRRRKDGCEVWADVGTSAVPSTGGLLLHLIAIDITCRKQAEEALGEVREPLQISATLAIAGHGEGLHSLIYARGDEVVTFAKPYLWR